MRLEKSTQGIFADIKGEEAERVTIIKGSLSPAEIILMTADELSSPYPNTIMTKDAMGNSLHSAADIEAISALPLADREQRIADLAIDLLTADVIVIERPQLIPTEIVRFS